MATTDAYKTILGLISEGSVSAAIPQIYDYIDSCKNYEQSVKGLNLLFNSVVYSLVKDPSTSLPFSLETMDTFKNFDPTLIKQFSSEANFNFNQLIKPDSIIKTLLTKFKLVVESCSRRLTLITFRTRFNILLLMCLKNQIISITTSSSIEKFSAIKLVTSLCVLSPVYLKNTLDLVSTPIPVSKKITTTSTPSSKSEISQYNTYLKVLNSLGQEFSSVSLHPIMCFVRVKISAVLTTFIHQTIDKSCVESVFIPSSIPIYLRIMLSTGLWIGLERDVQIITTFQNSSFQFTPVTATATSASTSTDSTPKSNPLMSPMNPFLPDLSSAFISLHQDYMPGSKTIACLSIKYLLASTCRLFTVLSESYPFLLSLAVSPYSNSGVSELSPSENTVLNSSVFLFPTPYATTITSYSSHLPAPLYEHLVSFISVALKACSLSRRVLSGSSSVCDGDGTHIDIAPLLVYHHPPLYSFQAGDLSNAASTITLTSLLATAILDRPPADIVYNTFIPKYLHLELEHEVLYRAKQLRPPRRSKKKLTFEQRAKLTASSKFGDIALGQPELLPREDSVDITNDDVNKTDNSDNADHTDDIGAEVDGEHVEGASDDECEEDCETDDTGDAGNKTSDEEEAVSIDERDRMVSHQVFDTPLEVDQSLPILPTYAFTVDLDESVRFVPLQFTLLLPPPEMTAVLAATPLSLQFLVAPWSNPMNPIQTRIDPKSYNDYLLPSSLLATIILALYDSAYIHDLTVSSRIISKLLYLHSMVSSPFQFSDSFKEKNVRIMFERSGPLELVLWALWGGTSLVPFTCTRRQRNISNACATMLSSISQFTVPISTCDNNATQVPLRLLISTIIANSVRAFSHLRELCDEEGPVRWPRNSFIPLVTIGYDIYSQSQHGWTPMMNSLIANCITSECNEYKTQKKTEEDPDLAETAKKSHKAKVELMETEEVSLTRAEGDVLLPSFPFFPGAHPESVPVSGDYYSAFPEKPLAPLLFALGRVIWSATLPCITVVKEIDGYEEIQMPWYDAYLSSDEREFETAVDYPPEYIDESARRGALNLLYCLTKCHTPSAYTICIVKHNEQPLLWASIFSMATAIVPSIGSVTAFNPTPHDHAYFFSLLCSSILSAFVTLPSARQLAAQSGLDTTLKEVVGMTGVYNLSHLYISDSLVRSIGSWKHDIDNQIPYIVPEFSSVGMLRANSHAATALSCLVATNNIQINDTEALDILRSLDNSLTNVYLRGVEAEVAGLWDIGGLNYVGIEDMSHMFIQELHPLLEALMYATTCSVFKQNIINTNIPIILTLLCGVTPTYVNVKPKNGPPKPGRGQSLVDLLDFSFSPCLPLTETLFNDNPAKYAMFKIICQLLTCEHDIEKEATSENDPSLTGLKQVASKGLKQENKISCGPIEDCYKVQVWCSSLGLVHALRNLKSSYQRDEIFKLPVAIRSIVMNHVCKTNTLHTKTTGGFNVKSSYVTESKDPAYKSIKGFVVKIPVIGTKFSNNILPPLQCIAQIITVISSLSRINERREFDLVVPMIQEPYYGGTEKDSLVMEILHTLSEKDPNPDPPEPPRLFSHKQIVKYESRHLFTRIKKLSEKNAKKPSIPKQDQRFLKNMKSTYDPKDAPDVSLSRIKDVIFSTSRVRSLSNLVYAVKHPNFMPYSHLYTYLLSSSILPLASDLNTYMTIFNEELEHRVAENVPMSGASDFVKGGKVKPQNYYNPGQVAGPQNKMVEVTYENGRQIVTSLSVKVLRVFSRFFIYLDPVYVTNTLVTSTVFTNLCLSLFDTARASENNLIIQECLMGLTNAFTHSDPSVVLTIALEQRTASNEDVAVNSTESSLGYFSPLLRFLDSVITTDDSMNVQIAAIECLCNLVVSSPVTVLLFGQKGPLNTENTLLRYLFLLLADGVAIGDSESSDVEEDPAAHALYAAQAEKRSVVAASALAIMCSFGPRAIITISRTLVREVKSGEGEGEGDDRVLGYVWLTALMKTLVTKTDKGELKRRVVYLLESIQDVEKSWDGNVESL